MTLQLLPSEFPLYMRKIFFSFLPYVQRLYMQYMTKVEEMRNPLVIYVQSRGFRSGPELS